MRRLRRISLWRVGAPLALLCAGLLFATSATNARGTDLRPSRNTTLAGLVEEQSRRSATLVRQHAALTHDIETLQAQQGSIDPKLAKQLDDLSEQVGTRPVTGPGLTVTLQDAPPEVVKENPDVDENWLVVHQQDIQAVVNALWAGGAEAMSIQNQRVISTTGIKCVGNSVVLHGVPYAAAVPDHRDRRPAEAAAGAGRLAVHREPAGLRGEVPARVRGEDESSIRCRRTRARSTCRARRSPASSTLPGQPDYDRSLAVTMVRMLRILVVDNYDSFVYNLVQYLQQLGAEAEVWRNDEVTRRPRSSRGSTASCCRPDRVRPEEAGVVRGHRDQEKARRAADLRCLPRPPGDRRRVRRRRRRAPTSCCTARPRQVHHDGRRCARRTARSRSPPPGTTRSRSRTDTVPDELAGDRAGPRPA